MGFDVGSISDLFNEMPLFTLIMFRMGGMLFTAPVFSHRSVPAKLRIALAFFFAVIAFPSAHATLVEIPNNLFLFGMIVFREIAVGAVLGFFVGLAFMVFSSAGMIAGRQVALEMASTLSPNTETGGSISALLYYMVGATLFLAINGHHWLIKALAFSYKVVPVDGFRFMPKLSDKMLESFSLYFSLGVKMAAPFIIIALISLVIVGVVLKVTEQQNLFVLELPMKSLVGFILFIVSAPFIVNFMITIFEHMQGEVGGLLRYMR